MVGKYISLEMIIEKTKDSYYDALQTSSENWHDDKNEYLSFTRYLLGVVIGAYRDLESRIELVLDSKISKTRRIRILFDLTLPRMTKKAIAEELPDISLVTIEMTLATLVKEGVIIKIGAGKSTAYIKRVD